MNFEKDGKNIIRIKNKKKDDPKKSTYIYLSDNNENVKKIIDEIELPPEERNNFVLQHLPYKNSARQILYISGQSGSGKSYYTLQYAKEYNRMFPKNEIWLFSLLTQDETLDKLGKVMKRIKLDEDFLNSKFCIDDFKDKLIIYDDTEAIRDKYIKEKLNNIADLILTTGRHNNVYMIITSHIITNGFDTKMILTECNSITMFLKTIGARSLDYVLKSYFALDKKQIERIKKLKTRWITICRTYPILIIYEYGCYVLD